VRRNSSRTSAPEFLHDYLGKFHISKRESENSFCPKDSWYLVYPEEVAKRRTYGETYKRISKSRQNVVGWVDVHIKLCMPCCT
jgi:hypothetical protein